ncbi:MAG: class IV adenylate cyclase [Terriglobia bacterium]
MDSRFEIEIKLRVISPAKIRQRIRSLGFHPVTPRLLERNTLFDFSDARLRSEHVALRLRTTGGKSLLTLKGKPRASSKHKVREEIETTVDSPQRLRRILDHLGLREVFSYTKHRTAYAPSGRPAKGRSELLLYDETPVGNFLELEGSARWIDEIARRLGYCQKDYITSSYPSLYLAKRRSQPSAARLPANPGSLAGRARRSGQN